jgi:hypothetical protein
LNVSVYFKRNVPVFQDRQTMLVVRVAETTKIATSYLYNVRAANAHRIHKQSPLHGDLLIHVYVTRLSIDCRKVVVAQETGPKTRKG